MADNNLARNRTNGPDFFADGDPLAELARLVGFDDVAQTRPAASEPAAPAPRAEPVFSLEDELMREFEQYHIPRSQPDYSEPVHDVPANDLHNAAVQPTAAEPAAVVVPQVENRAPAFSAMPSMPFEAERRAIAEALSLEIESAPVAVEPQSVQQHEEAGELPEFDMFDLAAELEGAIGASQESHSADRQAETAHRLSLEPVAYAPAFTESSAAEPVEMIAQPAAVQAPVTPVESAPVAPKQVVPATETRGKGAYTPGFRMPLANFNIGGGVQAINRPAPVDASPVVAETPQPAVVAAPEPLMGEPAAPAPAPAAAPLIPLGLDLPPRPIGQQSAPPVAPVAAPQAAEFHAIDELIYDVERYALNARAAETVAPVVAAPAPRIEERRDPQVEARPSPQAAMQAQVRPEPPVPQRVEPSMPAAPVAQSQFDPFADDEFELALDDLELDLADIVVAENSRPNPVAAPVAAAPAPVAAAPVVQPVSFSPVSQSVAAPIAAMPPMPAPVRAAEVDAPAADAELPFDPSLITDSEDHVEAIAELDVPALPVEEPQEEPVFMPDYDIDIDQELAALLTSPEATAAAMKKGNDPVVTYPAAASVAPQAAAPRSTYAELDDFERALEEDFRRSLQAPIHASAQDQDAMAYGEDEYEESGSRRSARRWIMPIAAVGALVVAGAGAYAMFGSGVKSMAGGEPVVIAADSDPIKVVPENPGGKTVPNQDKAVYDRVAGNGPEVPKQQSLISSDEQPVDVVQKTLMPDAGLPMDGDEDGQSTDVGETQDPRLLPQQQADAAAQNPVTVQPRRVKTMIVRPDGKLVEQEVPAVASAQEQKAPAASMKSGDVAAVIANAGQGRAAPAASSARPTGQTAAVMPASAPVDPMTDMAAAANATVKPSASTAKTPVPAGRPAQQPVNVVASVSDQGNVRAAPVAAPATAQTAAAAPGDYVIQIASLPTQADAQKSYQSLSSKFGSVIGGRGVDIKAAEIAGKGTFYRVRIPAGSKTDAVALCEKYRSAGGSCLVVR